VPEVDDGLIEPNDWQLAGALPVVRVTAEELLRDGERILGAGPRALAVTLLAGHEAELFGSPLLLRVPALELAGNALGEAGAQALAASPHTKNLVRLGLDSNRIGDAGAAALAASPHLRALRALSLADNRLTAAAFGDVTRGLPELRALSLAANPTAGDAGVAELAAAEVLKSLRALRLRNVGLGPEGARAITRAAFAPTLRRLDLSRNALADEGVRILAAARFDSLQDLDLGENDLGPAAIESLAQAQGLRALRVLGLHAKNEYEAVPSPAIEPLADAPNLDSLETVRVSEYWGSRAAEAQARGQDRVRGRAREIAREVTSYGHE
jgi:hypothetical protein